jgi:hypothetical protein
VAHNAAIEGGDTARAEELRARLLAKLDTRSEVKFTDGTILLGERFKQGVAPVLEVYFLAAGPAPVPERQFDIQSVVERAPFGSLVSADPKVRLAGMPLAIPPAFWKTGFIYVDRTEIRHRPGTEMFSGYFTGGSENTLPRPVSGSATVPLLALH